ncbi:unnamed protein product [Parnassius apollo]|uniref:(apollo) hypothetical protein n=1 Tax=Parnassius apollo TaxID=110799 RepID=A0A8S3Y0F6_PARAO|nr:unnamed protein product [Parnassius apollo]
MAVNNLNPLKLIEEVKKRPGLYDSERPADRLERLQLWKEIGDAMLPNWSTLNKATMYHTVLQIQRKWRSLRDAYNRELRARRSGVRIHRRVYIYFKRMSFLGGFEGTLSEDDDAMNDTTIVDTDLHVKEHSKSGPAKQPKRRKRIKKSSSDSEPPQDEIEMPVFNNVEIPGDMETDTDKLFLLSFLPEMRQLPLNIKMWTRAQIANIMQEAVACHFSNEQPGSSNADTRITDVKHQRRDSTD